jgi:hypothetical protein
LEWVGGFTGTLALGLNTITSISGMSLPPGATAIGAQVSHANLPAGTTILEIVGTTAYLSANATAAAAGASIAFLDFLPATGVEVRSPYVNGSRKVEGATKDYTKLFDGFRERIRFPAASPPGATAAVSMDAYMRRAA